LPVRTLDSFSASLGGPSTSDGSPSQGTQNQFDTALSDVNGLCEPQSGPPPNTAIAIDDMVQFLAAKLGTVADLVEAIATTNSQLGTSVTNLAQAVNAIAGTLGG
jgi:hypothetical protein